MRTKFKKRTELKPLLPTAELKERLDTAITILGKM